MTREEILNTPKIVDFMLDESVMADSREKLRKRLEKVCNLAIKALEQEPVLDKIRAEIEQLVSRYTISRERGCIGQVEWEDRLIREVDILQILDKYKAESEE